MCRHLILLTLALLLPVSLKAGVVVTPLGPVDGQKANYCVTGISKDGSVVVGYKEYGSGANPREQAFVWSATGGIIWLPGFQPDKTNRSIAYTVSRDGTMILGQSRTEAGVDYSATWEKVDDVWTPATRETMGNTSSRLTGISADGKVIVGSSASGGLKIVDFLPAAGLGGNRQVLGVSGDGETAVGYVTTGGTAAATFSIQTKVAVPLDALSSNPTSQANSISYDGGIVAGWAMDDNNRQRAVRWTSDGVKNLGALRPTDPESAATAVSSDGKVILGYSGLNAFLWTQELGMVNLQTWLTGQFQLDLSDWELKSATAISVNNQGLYNVAGNGIYQGINQNWLITNLPIAPKPR